MSDMLPLATYSLNVLPYIPTPAIDIEMPVTVRITMAALDPEALDDEDKPSTLRIVKRNPNFHDDDYDDILNGDYDEDEMDSQESEEEVEEEDKKSKKTKGKKSKKEESESEESEDISEDEDEVDGDDDEFEEYVLATLSPKTLYQQTLDLTIAPEEDVQFIVTGSYAISLVGNFVKHPFDTPMGDMEDSEDEEDEELSDSYYNDDYSDDEEAQDSDEYDLTPDEDEIAPAGSVEEIEEEEEEEKKSKHKHKHKHHEHDHEHDHEHEHKHKNKKRKQEEEEEEPKKEHKDKKVKFKKDLEEGPTKKTKEVKETKPKKRTLEGGIVIEDRTIGEGPGAQKGARVGMRYIGKLKNGKVFDKNTSGKPFVFKLGRGEVIRGWDIGVAGMAVGGERRITIPAPYAYGKQALPGIPANSELTFDVKLVSMK